MACRKEGSESATCCGVQSTSYKRKDLSMINVSAGLLCLVYRAAGWRKAVQTAWAVTANCCCWFGCNRSQGQVPSLQCSWLAMQGAWTECLLTLKLGHSGWESSLATAGQGGKCAHCIIRWFRKWVWVKRGVWGCVTCRERCTQQQQQGHMHVRTHAHTHCRIMVIAYSFIILLLFLRKPLKGL